jgi:hypothetical protein
LVVVTEALTKGTQAVAVAQVVLVSTALVVLVALVALE